MVGRIRRNGDNLGFVAFALKLERALVAYALLERGGPDQLRPARPVDLGSGGFALDQYGFLDSASGLHERHGDFVAGVGTDRLDPRTPDREGRSVALAMTFEGDQYIPEIVGE